MEYLLAWSLMVLLLVLLGMCGLWARKGGSPWVGG